MKYALHRLIIVYYSQSMVMVDSLVGENVSRRTLKGHCSKCKTRQPLKFFDDLSAHPR